MAPAWPRPRTLTLVIAAVVLILSGGALAACGQPAPEAEARPSSQPPATMPGGDAATSTSMPASPTTPAATPRVPGAATKPTATPTPAPTPPATRSTSARSDGIEVAPVPAAPKQASGAARDGGAGVEVVADTPDEEPSKPTATPSGGGAKGRGASQSAGAAYTWQDGDTTRRVVLQTDLVAHGARIAKVGSAGTGAGQPVFRSESSGTLMTLPGGVLLALDQDWTEDEVEAFFARNDIDESRVSELGWLTNGFEVETEPGFPSLNLANALAGQDGVEISSPNWSMENTTR